MSPVEGFADSVLPIIEADRADLVTHCHIVCEHVALEPTPSHTIDHCAVRVANRAGTALFTGDLLHSPLQLRYPELSTSADYDPNQAAETRHRFFEQCLETKAVICTMHHPPPLRCGQLARWHDGYRFAHVDWS
ncbi:glyoxylase-like metal-dependent hydrolase (beta-lactamase superfamily II) [Bradyrhizobium sp. GM0.4]